MNILEEFGTAITAGLTGLAGFSAWFYREKRKRKEDKDHDTLLELHKQEAEKANQKADTAFDEKDSWHEKAMMYKARSLVLKGDLSRANAEIIRMGGIPIIPTELDADDVRDLQVKDKK